MPGFKFTTYNFAGEVRDRYLVQNRVVSATAAAAGKRHHIIIVDRSGSMSCAMSDLKESLKKVLALHEYHQEGILVSLMSYSSSGDLTTHFRQVPIDKVDMSQIDRLRATRLTCISQALQQVGSLIDPSHVTGITLHSDGYANDPSSFSEKQAIIDACVELSKRNVFVNTVSHSDYADYQLLSRIANQASGRCMRAVKIKELYDSIVGTFATLVSGSVATLKVKNEGESYLVYIDDVGKKIIGSSGDMELAGVNKTSPGTIWGFTKVDEGVYNRAGQYAEAYNHGAVCAFARAKLAEGNINVAKYILASTGNVTLFRKNWRASNSSQIAEMAADLENAVFGSMAYAFQKPPIVVDDTVTVLRVLSTIEEYKDAVTLNFNRFLSGYNRRGLKRINGERDATGKLTEPWLDTVHVGDTEFGTISGLDISTTAANISITVTQKCRLIQKGSGQPIYRVAGVSVDPLTTFKSYTIVGDGELTVDEIPVGISTQVAFKALNDLGVLYLFGKRPTEFDHKQVYSVVLADLPVTKVSVDAGGVDRLAGVIMRMFLSKIICSVADAVTKEDSDKYTPEQVEDLKKHYLSKNLYLNFPTTNEYADLDEAIANGQVDVRNSYKVRIGTDGILGFDSFRSANAFLERAYMPVAVGNETFDKVNCTLLLSEGAFKFEDKPLSKKSKTTAADVLQKAVFDVLLKNDSMVPDADYTAVTELLQDAGAGELLDLLDRSPLGHGSKAETVAALSDAQRKLSKYIDGLYMENVFPALFFIGTMGMTPDDWDAKAMSADDVRQMWPDAKIGKNEEDGLFFKAGEVVFAVTSEKRYVTIDR